jgi:hypothetical protein
MSILRKRMPNQYQVASHHTKPSRLCTEKYVATTNHTNIIGLRYDMSLPDERDAWDSIRLIHPSRVIAGIKIYIYSPT